VGVIITSEAGPEDATTLEYVALLQALQCALLLKAKALRVFSDSEVMVKQMTGEYSCRSPRPLFPELDLSEVGPVARFLDLPRSSREQH
jgi:ribonuclease HI